MRMCPLCIGSRLVLRQARSKQRQQYEQSVCEYHDRLSNNIQHLSTQTSFDYLTLKRIYTMGQITSACCNPSLTFTELEQSIQQPKEVFFAQTNCDPFQMYKPPNEKMLQSLKIASQYRTDRSRNTSTTSTTSQTQSQQKLWAIELKIANKVKQKEWIFGRGGIFSPTLSGEMTIYFPNGQIFVGKMENNQPTYGIFAFREGCFYVGNIKDLNAEGYGRYQNRDNGYIYEGNWSKSLVHGKGREIYRNGDRFQGDFMYGAKFGHGVYSFSDGKIYEGSFYYNQSDGHGKMTYPNGNSYEGDWKLGQYHGHGRYIWANGESYEGQYQEGRRHGKGKYIFKNNKSYQGDWENGMQSGQGILLQGYDEIKGLWEAGQLIS